MSETNCIQYAALYSEKKKEPICTSALFPPRGTLLWESYPHPGRMWHKQRSQGGVVLCLLGLKRTDGLFETATQRLDILYAGSDFKVLSPLSHWMAVVMTATTKPIIWWRLKGEDLLWLLYNNAAHCQPYVVCKCVFWHYICLTFWLNGVYVCLERNIYTYGKHKSTL